MKCKIFDCLSGGELQKQLSQFLSENPNVDIVSMTQSESVSGGCLWIYRESITLTILYR